MRAILKREVQAYFSSPLGYVFLGVFYLFAGYFYWSGCLLSASSNMRPVFSSLLTVIMVIVPLLTMRLIAEDKKQKTDQLLLTAPISVWELVLGKFFAALTIYLLALAVLPLFAAVTASLAPFDGPVFAGLFCGMLLMGAGLIAIGMFISSLTESQVIAAVVSFFVMMMLVLVDSIALIVPAEPVAKILTGISFYSRYTDFSMGLFNFANVVFFLSVAGLFLFLTARVIEKRRWS